MCRPACIPLRTSNLLPNLPFARSRASDAPSENVF